MSITKISLALSALLIILLLTIAPGLAQGLPPQPPPTPTPVPGFVPGEIVVKFQPYVGIQAGQGSLRTEGLRAIEASVHSGLIRVQVAPGHEAEVMAKLMARGDVEFATLNHTVEASGDPNDTYYSAQWALDQYNDHDIDAPEAWDIHTGTGSITIAFLDTGVDLDHPDLQAKIVPGYDFVNGDNQPDDDHYLSHGTHVAGIAAAITNNNTGVAGVSWGAKIMPLKVLSSSGGGSTFNVAQAIYFAVDNGAQIINMSLGAKNSSWPCSWPDVESALDYAVSHGVLVVAASGNDSQNGVNCPAAFDQVIAVGATTSSDTRAYYSNYGPRLDIVAPGGDNSLDGIYSTINSGQYGYLSGTSMATPFVSGLAALVWSYEPTLTYDQVRSVIENTADDLGTTGWDELYGHGRINAWQALNSLSLKTTPAQLTMMMDDASNPIVQTIELSTSNASLITWTASISPAVSWLTISSPVSGTVSTASSPVGVSVIATQPSLYNTYTTTIVISGTNASGAVFGPRTTEVELYYLPKIHRLMFPFMLRE